MSKITFKLEPVPPFRLDLTVWILRRGVVNVMDRWDGQAYARTLSRNGQPVEVTTVQSGSPEEPHLEIIADGDIPEMKGFVTASLERLLGFSNDLSGFYRFAYDNKVLEPLVRRFIGFKPPRFPTAFEAAVNGIACQQVSLNVVITLLNRLSQAYGRLCIEGNLKYYAFPEPQVLASIKAEVLRRLGFSYNKSRAIIELASAITGGLDLESLETAEDEEALSMLYQLQGIGRWTAEYILLRGLGRWHIFPGDDVGARTRLKSWLGLEGELDYDGVQGILAQWSPYAGLIYFHLLLCHLQEKGFIRP